MRTAGQEGIRNENSRAGERIRNENSNPAGRGMRTAERMRNENSRAEERTRNENRRGMTNENSSLNLFHFSTALVSWIS